MSAEHWRSPASGVRLPAPLVRCNALFGTALILQGWPTMILAHARAFLVEAGRPAVAQRRDVARRQDASLRGALAPRLVVAGLPVGPASAFTKERPHGRERRVARPLAFAKQGP